MKNRKKIYISYAMNYIFHAGTSSETISGVINTYENKDSGNQKFEVSFTGNPSQTVDFKKLIIDWKLNGTTIGQTKHKLYVTFDTPISSGSSYDETCVWLGCTAAKGKSTEQDVFNAIWSEFQTMTITTRDNRLLSYWGNGQNTGVYYYVDDLLEYGDGRCGAWASLANLVFNYQGIHCYKVHYKHIAHLDYASDNLFTRDGHIYRLKRLNQKSTSFQGNGKPYLSNFKDHAFNMISFNNNYSIYFDVTGLSVNNATYNSAQDLLENSIELIVTEQYNDTEFTIDAIASEFILQ